MRTAAASARRGALGVLWLLFFPNAPYLLTDFIHLGASSTTPLWYDGLMLSAFAWTALLLGFVSLFVMQALWRGAVGSLPAWAAVVGALALASIGIYLGRYVGFNSWDALLHPVRVAHVLNAQGDNPLRHPRLTGSLVVLTGFLDGRVRGLLQPRRAPVRNRPRLLAGSVRVVEKRPAAAVDVEQIRVAGDAVRARRGLPRPDGDHERLRQRRSAAGRDA